MAHHESEEETMDDGARREREVANLREARAMYLRIMSREQGRRDGWYAVLEEVKKLAADAFMRDDDHTADLLKGIVKTLGGAAPRYPYLLRVDDSEGLSMQQVDEASARLADLESED